VGPANTERILPSEERDPQSRTDCICDSDFGNGTEWFAFTMHTRFTLGLTRLISSLSSHLAQVAERLFRACRRTVVNLAPTKLCSKPRTRVFRALKPNLDPHARLDTDRGTSAHGGSRSGAQLVVISWLFPSDSDRSLAKVAEFCGVSVRQVILTPDSLTADQPLFPTDKSRCIAISCDAIGAMLDIDDDEEKTRGRILGDASHVLVYGFRPLEQHQKVLKVISSAGLSRVEKLDSDQDTSAFEVSSQAREVCQQFSGLTVGCADPETDYAFVESGPDASRRKLICIDKKPFFVQTSIRGCQVMFLACSAIADIDGAVFREVSIIRWFSRLAPAMMFLRYVFGEQCWHSNCPSACLFIDDPLLIERYGFLDLPKLLASMDRCGFATSVAFIPWNWRRTDPAVANLLKKYSRAFSVSVHGCDHTRHEFGSSDAPRLTWKVRSATEKMALHERLTGLPFDRVMVFPHGAFSVAALKALRAHNYAAAINSTPYAADLDQGRLALRVLLEVAVTRYRGVPVFTRRYPCPAGEFAFDLFLGKPAFIVAHHDYFKDGGGHLEKLVGEVNSLDERLVWRSPQQACEGSYLRRVDADGSIGVKLYTNRLRVANSDGRARRFVVHPEREPQGLETLTVTGTKGGCHFERDRTGLFLELAAGEQADVTFHHGESAGESRKDSPIHVARVLIRRFLCEFRDRYISQLGVLFGPRRQPEEPRLRAGSAVFYQSMRT